LGGIGLQLAIYRRRSVADYLADSQVLHTHGFQYKKSKTPLFGEKTCHCDPYANPNTAIAKPGGN
jgi:hypothetical protein